MKIIMTKGLPASGKTTWAKSLMRDHPFQYKRINKDDLRAMLDNSLWSQDEEKFILKVRDALIVQALNQGYNVIVDDTNLAPKHEKRILEIALAMKANFEIKDFTDIPLDVCLKRDSQRVNSVGIKVIKDMYDKYLKPKPETVLYKEGLPEAVICDLDGTLALHNGRNPYDASTCDQDLLNKPVHGILRHSGKIFIFVSGRYEKFRPQTETFLKTHKFYDYTLYMRPDNDNRRDEIVKKEIYNNHIKDNYNILFVLDDRDRVVAMWRQLGLTCLQVADGNF